MIFLFESIVSGDFTFVNASDLYHAIKIFESHGDYYGVEKYHVYTRIV